MDRINEFKPCPLCGKTDRLELSKREWFYESLHKDGIGSCVRLSCERCHLDLYQHTYKWSDFNTWNYDIVVGELKKKWNSIKR